MTNSASTTARTRSPADRRQNILGAAQRLFAARGFHGVSIRDIAGEGGVPLALVGYHFGTKVELYRTVCREGSAWFEAQLRALATLRSDCPPAFLLDETVRALVLPALTLAGSPEGRDFLRLTMRVLSEQQDQDEPLVRELLEPLAGAFIDNLARALPDVPRETLARCHRLAIGALLHHVADVRADAPLNADAGTLLMRFITAGVRSACGEPFTAAGSRSP